LVLITLPVVLVAVPGGLCAKRVCIYVHPSVDHIQSCLIASQTTQRSQ